MKKLLLLLTLLTSTLLGDTVVLVPGFMVHGSSLLPLSHLLRRSGFGAYIWDYPAQRYTIEEHGAHLVFELQKIAALRPCEPIHFATHSVGGLIIRAALNHPCCPQEAKIGRAVLVATPSQGSYLARRMKNNYLVKTGLGKKLGWQLMHYCPEDFDAIGCFPPCMQVLVVAGTKGVHLWFDGKPNDTLIMVDETRLPCQYYLSEFPVTHGNLITCGPVLEAIKNFITCGP